MVSDTRKFLIAFVLLALVTGACSTPTPVLTPLPTATSSPTATSTRPPAIIPPTPAPAINTPTAEPTSVPTEEPARFAEPAGCRQPSGSLTRVEVNGFNISQRTYEMLQYAATLSGGTIDITNTAISQGNYNSGAEPSQTHQGGVIDIAVHRPNSFLVLYKETPGLILALRTAGFAAWLRDWDEMEAGSDIHIHAVAIGDPELPPEAIEQLTGAAGYFRGYAGYLRADGSPAPDHDGSPVICEWMRAAGYTDLRPEAEQIPQPAARNWMLTLKDAAAADITTTHEDSIRVARGLGYLASGQEDPSLMCGPLAGSLLQQAGMLPPGVGPWNNLHNYWLADPEVNGKPWSMFSEPDYSLYQYKTPLAKFDFAAWPLRPGDFLYTYAAASGFEHMFIVTEVDEAGQAFTVANQYRGELIGYPIERLMLYDPNDPGKGAIYEEWQNGRLGRTGHDGFDVLRINGLSQAPGSLYETRVRPGDTVYTLAAKYFSTPEAIAAVNPGQDLLRLQIGQWVWVPVNLTGWESPVEAQPLPDGAVENALQRHIALVTATFPSGSWHIYIENLSSGQVAVLNETAELHPASTIKLPISLAVYDYLEQDPSIKMTEGPIGGTRTFAQLLDSMLIKSEEAATAELESFLYSYKDRDPDALLQGWGAGATTIVPRRSTAADIGLLWKRFYLGELLSDDSTEALLSILRVPSRGDDQRLGGGLPADIRLNLAHKTGTTFENDLGVVADTGVVETPAGAYVIVIIANGVSTLDYEAANALIADISRMTYEEFTG